MSGRGRPTGGMVLVRNLLMTFSHCSACPPQSGKVYTVKGKLCSPKAVIVTGHTIPPNRRLQKLGFVSLSHTYRRNDQSEQ
ncbi:MAG: hypothetical protein VX262_07695, partial [Acidobacteriota bacterium]|nr:hypothetical protein [Acidobacteriota bacterium]